MNLDCDPNRLVNMWMNKHQLHRRKIQPGGNADGFPPDPPLAQHSKTRANSAKRATHKKNQRRRQAERNQQVATERKEFIEKRHNEIDLWLLSQKKEQQNLEMKRMADSTLSEVRRKMQSTEKMAKLLEALTKLRNIRKQKRLNQGQDVGSSKTEETFHKSIKDLKSFIGSHYKDYQAEEKTLKVMLEDEKHEKERQDDKRKQEIQERLFKRREKQLDEWLFGDQSIPDDVKPFYDYYNQSRIDFDAFVRIRRQWDDFVAAPDNPSASSVPRGWVQPTEPSSEAWKAFQLPNS